MPLGRRNSCSEAGEQCGGLVMPTGDFDPDRILATLHEADVRFILVGGMAAILHGDVGVTIDLDLVPERESQNLERLARALRALEARIRTSDVPDGLSFDCSGAFLHDLPRDSILNLTTSAGAVDLTFQPSGTHGYADLHRDAIEIEIAGGVRILVASLADVIRSKEAAGREKDRLALPRLRRLLDRIHDRE
jgi:hypothetical protein